MRAGLGVALVPQMTWYSAQEGVASLPVGDQECYRYLYLSWKQMPSCRSQPFSFANISLITSGSMSALRQTVPIPWNDTGKAAGNETVSGGFLLFITSLL